MCPACGQPGDRGYVVATGSGAIFSFVVHHPPPVPGKRLPMMVALVQLQEGVRFVGEMRGTRADLGSDCRSGRFGRGDDDLTLPAWRPAEGALPDRVIAVTPTLVVSTALATRDF